MKEKIDIIIDVKMILEKYRHNGNLVKAKNIADYITEPSLPEAMCKCKEPKPGYPSALNNRYCEECYLLIRPPVNKENR